MLDIGWSEFFLIAALALLVLGPKDLTRLSFMLGHWVRQARQAMSDVRTAFEAMAEELESDKPKIAPPPPPPPSKNMAEKAIKKPVIKKKTATRPPKKSRQKTSKSKNQKRKRK